MFRTGSFILRALLALVLLAGLLGVVGMAFRAGYSRGYVLGVAAEGDAPQVVPGYPMRPDMMPYYGRHFFPPVGLFFCGGLLFLAVLGAIFRPRHWHHHHAAWAGHPGHGPWAHDWAHEHPHGPEQSSPPSPAAEGKAEDSSSNAA